MKSDHRSLHTLDEAANSLHLLDTYAYTHRHAKERLHEAIQDAIDYGHPIAKIAAHSGYPKATLYRWLASGRLLWPNSD